MNYSGAFKIGNRAISNSSPTYFIADIGANHDGSLDRARELIKLAAASGVDCAKFQHFNAKDIVSREGFANLKTAHQTNWDKPVYEVYEDYSINRDWSAELAETCRNCGIDFMSTPYDLHAVDILEPLVKAFKIGSGDITYHSFIRYIATSHKPIFLATGASVLREVIDAVDSVLEHHNELCLMQCNTNYTGETRNINYVNLNVLKTYSSLWPGLPLGISDHTPSDTSVLGAVALGARVIEKHFTDDQTRRGPDHEFALTSKQWMTMRIHVGEMEDAMGDGIKRIEENERESSIVQRRAIRATRDIPAGTLIQYTDTVSLRPTTWGSYAPYQIDEVVGKTLRRPLTKGQEFTYEDFY